LGRELGVPTILVRTGYGDEHLRTGRARPDFVVNDLREAAKYLGELS
jgi:ribonucleotide monophosphatase NagD (HAD superfamily)